ncbi:hypothetical protein OSTOST_15383 [Ostertagia ostertagi]
MSATASENWKKNFQATMGDLHYSIGATKHRVEIREFLMNHFLVEETMNAATSITEDEFAPFADTVLDTSLRKPLSVICRAGNGEIVGVALHTIHRRGEPVNAEPLGNKAKRPQIDAIASICNECHKDVWQILGPEINTVLELDIISVAEQYQRRGIARKMLEKCQSPQVLKEHSIQGVVTQATSHANQTLLKNRGHTVLKEVPFTRYVNDRGSPLIKPLDGTQSVKLFWKSNELF